MEPTISTFKEIGRLCVGWSFLESMTEATLWGILDLDNRLGPLISWKQDMRGRWALIVEYAPTKHDETAIATLRQINKDIQQVNADRNIVVHGLVHSTVTVPLDWEHGKAVPGGLQSSVPFDMPPCWTIFRGEGKGRNYPISSSAVKIITENIHNIVVRLAEFNKTHNYIDRSTLNADIVASWPTRL